MTTKVPLALALGPAFAPRFSRALAGELVASVLQRGSSMRITMWMAASCLALGLVGCASAEQPIVVDPSSDPAWIPPDQGVLQVEDRAEPEKPNAKPRARHLQQPNHRETESVLQAKSRTPSRPRS